MITQKATGGNSIPLITKNLVRLSGGDWTGVGEQVMKMYCAGESYDDIAKAVGKQPINVRAYMSLRTSADSRLYEERYNNIHKN